METPRKLWFLKDNKTGKYLTADLSYSFANSKLDISFTDNIQVAYCWNSETECIQWEDKHQNTFDEICTPIGLTEKEVEEITVSFLASFNQPEIDTEQDETPDPFNGDIEIRERMFIVEDSEPMTLSQHLADSWGWTAFAIQVMCELDLNDESQLNGDFPANIKRVK